MLCKFWSLEGGIHCLRHGDFSLEFEFQSATFFGVALWNCTLKIGWWKILINWGMYATMNTREGGVGVVFVLEMGGMWLSKVARRGDKSNVISKNFFRYCVGWEDLYGAWSFGFLRKWKGWKPLLHLGFQPLLSSIKFRYFLLFSDMLDCLENR